MFQLSTLANDSAVIPFPPLLHGGADDSGGGLVGMVDHLLTDLTQFSERGNSFELFPGIQTLGFNVHPLFVHFPIAFLSVFFLFELITTLGKRNQLRPVTNALLYLGTLGALATITTGLIAASIVPHGEEVHEIIERHEHIGLTIAAIAVTLSLWRLLAKSISGVMANTLYFSLATIMVIGIIFGADLGGLMVYHYGVGVKTLQSSGEYHHHHE